MKEQTQPPILPWDSYNQKLVSNVHPLDWKNPTPAERYNLVVIGGGTAGLVSAIGAAGLGPRVALIEKQLLGGDCLNVGCVPSKAIIRAARAATAMHDAAQFGVNVQAGVTVDFGKAMERMHRLRADISPHDSAKRFTELSVDVFLGCGKFTGSDRVKVAGQTLRFSKAVIATGARAAAPPIAGLSEVPYLTNETLFSLTELPKRLGIISAGPIGCEMAQAFARLGSKVILAQSQHGILPREDRDAAGLVRAAMERDGVELLGGAKEIKLSKNPGGVRMQGVSSGQVYSEVVDQLLIAVGRAPNVEGLGLEAAGVVFDKKGVKVSDLLRTANPRIFACGDICSPFQFTHAGDVMARIVIRNALFKGRAKVSALNIPWATYTSPEVAHVGLYEEDAQEKAIEVDTYTQQFADVDRAILDGETEGFVRVHVRKNTDEILGATIVAAHAGDLISEITLAMNSRIGLKTIRSAIHPYPTQAEAIRKVGDLYNRTRLTPFVKSLMGKWLAWTR